MKIYVKETRVLEGKQYLKGWHEVSRYTAYHLLEKFPTVCRLARRAYGEGWRELQPPER